MTTKISRSSKGFTALLLCAVIAICSCNDNATTEEVKTDTQGVMAPAAMDTMPRAMDTMPVMPVDTNRDTKVPRN